jgi:hypothetical protein
MDRHSSVECRLCGNQHAALRWRFGSQACFNGNGLKTINNLL